jgi:hypothetical protein
MKSRMPSSTMLIMRLPPGVPITARLSAPIMKVGVMLDSGRL